jgi:Fe-S-cluster-containing dehydrogenase component
MTKRYAFLVDADLCIGCSTCGMACKNLYHQDQGIVWRKIYPLAESIYPHRDRAYYSLACNHCDNPCCMEGCPVGAFTKRDDGIVVHNQDACIGCQNCVRTCPFGAPRYNPAEGRAEKCSMCYERIDQGLLPACVQACPTGALTLIDLATFDDPSAVQFPPGFPNRPDVGPSTRFKTASQPKIVRRSA